MAYRQPVSEPIAIVGSGCRFAGGVSSPSDLWKLLQNPIDLSKEVPSSRFNIKAFHHPDGEHHGTTNAGKSYWLEHNLKAFDASFFNITPKEAEAIDPQQRMLLEVVYEALDSAGYNLQSYSGKNVGVFAGLMTADYDTTSMRDELSASQYFATGNARSIMSNRISYFFNFNGPSMTIDTACSSSLVALHQAVLSLRSGESEIACVAGVNLMLVPEQYIAESSLHMLSPTGHCQMWDAAGDGYARGEGVAAIFVKPLSRALADGDAIQAIIRETGVNSDGRSKGITMPNSAAQASLIRDTYRRAGLNLNMPADRCQYFEAHGTGTQAGDPNEACAIEEAFFLCRGPTTDSHAASGNHTNHSAIVRTGSSRIPRQVSGSAKTPRGSPSVWERPHHAPVSASQAVTNAGAAPAAARSSTSSPPPPANDTTIDAPRQTEKLLVGSVKTVIGHTEGAAGMAGLLKVVQAMQHGVVPPNLHLKTLNPSVAPFCTNLEIPTQGVPWPVVPAGQPRRASVNSFGFGGTNSHAIVEKYEPAIHDAVAHVFSSRLLRPRGTPNVQSLLESDSSDQLGLPLLLSANSQMSLVEVAKGYRDYLTNYSPKLDELAFHTYNRRTALPYRLAMGATSPTELAEKLDLLVRSLPASPTLGTRCKPHDSPPKILGVFTGQGAQWATMSADLMRVSCTYVTTIRSLDAVLRACPDPPNWSLEHEILANADLSRVHKAVVAQPLCTALQIALVDLLGSLGIKFDTVVGHSSGEIAAAYTAGRISARDAILIAYHRGMYAHLAHGRGNARGGMLAAGVSRQEAQELCSRREFGGGVCVAASNSPTSVTLSGDIDTVNKVRNYLLAENKFARALQVDTAYHSPHMEEPAAKYLEALASCGISPSAVGNDTLWISSVYGAGEASQSELGASYWRDNMVQPVLFYEAISNVLETMGPFDCAIEVGPHPALKGPATQTMKEKLGQTIPYSGLLDRKKNDCQAFNDFLGWMWTRFGSASDQIRRFVSGSTQPNLLNARVNNLPAYPWDHSHEYWRESRIARQYHHKPDAPHELLGVRTRDDNEFQLRWRNILKMDRIPWNDGHRFQGQALLPASAYCVMAYDAARTALGSRSATVIELYDLQFLSGITIEEDGPGVEVLFSLTMCPETKEKRSRGVVEASFTITSVLADGSTDMKMNFTGNVRIVLGQPSAKALPSRPTQQPETLKVSAPAFYDMMVESGLDYTGPFQGLTALERRFNFASGTVKKLHGSDTTGLRVSPATLDSCFQTAFASYSSPGDNALWTSFLPKTIDRVRFSTALCDIENNHDSMLGVDTYLTHALPTTKDSAAMFTVDILIFNQESDMEIQVEGLTVASFSATRPEDDHELYLTTVMDLDPEEEIIAPSSPLLEMPDASLIESCDRVATYYRPRAKFATFDLPSPPETPQSSMVLPSPKRRLSRSSSGYSSGISLRAEDPPEKANPWAAETEDSLAEFIWSSPYHRTLQFVRTVGQNLPDVLPGMLPAIIKESHNTLAFLRHLSRVAKQIAHKYPRMSILGLTEADYAITELVLTGLEESFASYRIGAQCEKNLMERLPTSKALRRKIVIDELQLEEEESDKEGAMAKYDLVILSTSLIKHGQLHRSLENLQSLMRPGAFLILIQLSGSPLRMRLRRCAGLSEDTDETLTPPVWPDVLGQCGFVQPMANANQYHPSGFSLVISQKQSMIKDLILRPFDHEAGNRLTNNLLILGGKQDQTAATASELVGQMRDRCGAISMAQSLDELDPETAEAFTGAIFLNDLDEPILASMTEERLGTLRALIKPDMVILWVTCDARSGSPDHAASFGFARTMHAETPSLALQMLDLESLDRSADTITQTFACLALQARLQKAKGDAGLWTHEREIHIENGRRLIPRVLPWKEANQRANAPRRVVSEMVNTIENMVEIVPTQCGDGSARYETRIKPLWQPDEVVVEQELIKVDYSSLDVLNIDWAYSSHICIGRNMLSGSMQVVLSKTNASFVAVPSTCVSDIDDVNHPVFMAYLVRYLTALTIAGSARGKSVVLVEPDHILLECARLVLAEANIKVQVYTADRDRSITEPDMHYVHPLASSREVAALFPADGAHVFDFLPEGADLSEVFVDHLPEACDYHSRFSLLTSKHLNTLEDAGVVEQLWEDAVALARGKARISHANSPGVGLMSVPDLLRESEPTPEAFQLLDWRADRQVSHTIAPLVETTLLRPYRTYVLVGLTRDLGQSICSLFVEQGARYLVLTSRNPPKTQPQWAEELARTKGVTVRIESMDVTDLSHVVSFKTQIAELGLPPVGGVINGAMVLDDRVFSALDSATLHRVMAPKTDGSANLDRVFCEPDMDFFIMTSSFAAIGGHAGQSNYAAANMYMNGLAANRRRRGLPGSALNIGVIYGLGFLHREKDGLYEGLEREGYPPISERDLHHMFVEAIVAGRPVNGGSKPDERPVTEITTGLSRFHPGAENPLHWHLDPRFSHYTVPADSDDEGEAEDQAGPKQNVAEQLVAAADRDAMLELLAPAFARHMEALLQLEAGSVGTSDVSMAELGVDSLVAVEVRAWVWKVSGRDVAVMKILGARSIVKMCEEIVDGMLAARVSAGVSAGDMATK